jgi:protocatechuate 3,4-dioxygenase, alpha subunit
MTGITPSQTVGPFFAPALTPGKDYPWHQPIGNDLITPDASGQRIRIEGRVFDGDGAPVNDSMIEIWQADAAGRYAHPADKQRPNAKFIGFGRAGTDAHGRFSFSTIKPGAVAGPDGKPQAPHIAVAVFARGLPRHCYTRIYFSDEAGNTNDPILALVPTDRRRTLIAKREEKNGGAVYTFDVRLQGENETVFFDV